MIYRKDLDRPLTADEVDSNFRNLQDGGLLAFLSNSPFSSLEDVLVYSGDHMSTDEYTFTVSFDVTDLDHNDLLYVESYILDGSFGVVRLNGLTRFNSYLASPQVDSVSSMCESTHLLESSLNGFEDSSNAGQVALEVRYEPQVGSSLGNPMPLYAHTNIINLSRIVNSNAS